MISQVLLPLLVWATVDPDTEEAVHEATEHNFLNSITLGQMIAAALTIGILIGFFKKINPIMHRLNNLMDDWNGEPERPGVPERKGVMERMSDQDAQLTANGERVKKHEIEVSSHLNAISADLKPLTDIHAPGNHQEVLTRLDAIASQSERCGAHMTRLEHLLNRHIRESKAWVEAVDRATAERDFKTPPWPDLPNEDE